MKEDIAELKQKIQAQEDEEKDDAELEAMDRQLAADEALDQHVTDLLSVPDLPNSVLQEFVVQQLTGVNTVLPESWQRNVPLSEGGSTDRGAGSWSDGMWVTNPL